MLAPEELRKGNIVSVSGQYQQIKEVRTGSITVKGDIVCMSESVKPVDLKRRISGYTGTL